MLKLKEKAINNTFQIKEDFETGKIKRSFYRSFGSHYCSNKVQLPGKVKVFSEEEVFLYRIKKYNELCRKKGEL